MKQQKKRISKKSTKLLAKPKLKYASKRKRTNAKPNDVRKVKKHNLFDSIKEKSRNFFAPISKHTKKYSKIIREKTISFSKKVFFASVKFGLMFSENAQCPDCKVVNKPVSHKWENITNGFNNIGKPAPDFGKRVNSYKCKHCKKEYTKKLLIKEAICPCCSSINSIPKLDDDKIYDEDTATYEDQSVNIGFLKDYPWGIRVVDLHQIFYCRECDLNLWQYQSESRRDCCPYCHKVCSAQKKTFVEDVSTYSKSEIVDGRHMIVAYERGYETTEYCCPECGEVVYSSGGWYDRKL